MVSKWIVENGWRGAWGDEKKGFIQTELNGQRVIRVYSPVQFRDAMLGTSFASEGNEKARCVYWANDPIKDLLAVLRYNETPILHVHTDVPCRSSPPPFSRRLLKASGIRSAGTLKLCRLAYSPGSGATSRRSRPTCLPAKLRWKAGVADPS